MQFLIRINFNKIQFVRKVTDNPRVMANASDPASQA